MRWTITVRFVLVMTGLVLAGPAAYSATPDPSAQAPRPWKAVASSGPVVSAPSAAEATWTPLHRGDRLEPRTLVRTGERGRATLTCGGDVLIVDPDSHVELPQAVGAGDDASVVQSSGSVVYEIDRRRGRSFEVRTPYLVAGVKGTVFMVSVTDSYASVTVDEGLVQVTSRTTGESLDIGAGESVRLDTVADGEMEHVRLRASGKNRDVSDEARELARAEFRHLARVTARHEIWLEEGGAEPDRLDPEPDALHGGGIDEEVDRLHDIQLHEEELTEDLVDRQKKTSATANPGQQ